MYSSLTFKLGRNDYYLVMISTPSQVLYLNLGIWDRYLNHFLNLWESGSGMPTTGMRPITIAVLMKK